MWSWKVIKHYWHSFTQENRLCKQFVLFLCSILVHLLVFSRPSFLERNFTDACWPPRRPLPPLHLPPLLLCADTLASHSPSRTSLTRHCLTCRPPTLARPPAPHRPRPSTPRPPHHPLDWRRASLLPLPDKPVREEGETRIERMTCGS
jgi:hypothetical protein